MNRKKLAKDFYQAVRNHEKWAQRREKLREKILDEGSFQTPEYSVSISNESGQRTAGLQDFLRFYPINELMHRKLIRTLRMKKVTVKKRGLRGQH